MVCITFRYILSGRLFSNSCIVSKGLASSANSNDVVDMAEFFKGSVLNLLVKRKFLSLSSSSDITVGLLGKEIMRNLNSEWRRCISVNENMEETKCKPSSRSAMFNEIGDVIVKKLKFGVPEASSFAMNLSGCGINGTDVLALVKLVEKSAADLELENLNTERIWWLKNYLRKPAEVRSKWDLNPENSMKDVSVFYNEEILVQRSLLLRPDCFKQIREFSIAADRSESMSILIVYHQLHNLLAMILADSFHIVSFPNYRHTMMRIHPYLAPVKTALYVEGELTKVLQQLASEMTDWLRRMGISCWNATELEINFTDLDESGVPYVIVLSSQTIDDGILRVRNRDSSLKIQAHISELLPKLKLYLQPRS